jgi:AraC-like DNA-binding protein
VSRWSLFNEVDIGRAGEAAIRLADLLSSNAALSNADDGNSIFPDYAGEIFAKGRYRSHTVRPFMQYSDCDMELVSDLRVKGYHPPTLCIGVLLKGTWQSTVNGKALDMQKIGIPAMLAAGEAFEAVTKQTVGQQCRMAAVSIGAEFFSSQEDEENSLWHVLQTFLKSDHAQYEFPNCEVLKSILQRLYNNPYHGTIGRLYTESLALSALVELAVHLQGGHRHCTVFPLHHNRAFEAREILNQNITEASTISELAHRVGMSEVTLRRAFKTTFGVTIVEYVRDRRLDAARVMLREGRFLVAEIAYRVGYSDPANFTNAYRRRFGHPPVTELRGFKS